MKLFDMVRLKRDIPTKELVKGQAGTIVEDYGNDALEVEFADTEGKPLLTTLWLYDLELVEQTTKEEKDEAQEQDPESSEPSQGAAEGIGGGQGDQAEVGSGALPPAKSVEGKEG